MKLVRGMNSGAQRKVEEGEEGAEKIPCRNTVIVAWLRVCHRQNVNSSVWRFLGTCQEHIVDQIGER